MSYLLKNKQEFSRLERQSALAAYDFRAELTGLSIPPQGRILDAGCGSGIVSRHLAGNFPDAQVLGLDASAELLAAAKAASEMHRNLTYAQGDLLVSPLPASDVDFVLCRYVLQHLGSAERVSQALRNFRDAMRPGALLCLIDVDGFFANLHPCPPVVAEALARFVSASPIDLFIGRKLPGLLRAAGLESIQWSVEAISCQGQARADEVELMRQRLENMRPFLVKFLGGDRKYREFSETYLTTLSDESTVYFFNKFKATARAAAGKLRAVK